MMIGGRGHADRGEDLPVQQRRRIDPSVVFPCRNIALALRALSPIDGAEGQHDRGHVVAGIAVGEVAPKRAAVSNLRVGDEQRGLANDRAPGDKEVRADQFMLRGHRPDDQSSGLAADGAQLA